jgi:hypothetical protein
LVIDPAVVTQDGEGVKETGLEHKSFDGAAACANVMILVRVLVLADWVCDTFCTVPAAARMSYAALIDWPLPPVFLN